MLLCASPLKNYVVKIIQKSTFLRLSRHEFTFAAPLSFNRATHMPSLHFAEKAGVPWLANHAGKIQTRKLVPAHHPSCLLSVRAPQ